MPAKVAIVVDPAVEPSEGPPGAVRSPQPEVSLDDVRTDAYAEVLHDEPLQLVIAAMLHLDGLPAQYRPPSVQRAVDLLERAAERLRQLIHAMSVPGDHDPLPAAVRSATDALLGGRGVRFEHRGDTAVPLSAPATRAAREILVAALSDLRSRVSISVVTLDVRTVDATVVITLGDDGGDRLPPTPRGAVATPADLRARAAEVGGTLDVGAGSGLTLTLPADVDGPVPATS